MLFPIQNEVRNIMDLSGIWDFQTDPQDMGEQNHWFNGLEDPRPIAVPGSWNDQYEDLSDYLGMGWYVQRTHLPSAWKGQRVFLRVGSANYAAKVWINGQLVTQHQGGHVPFSVEITHQIAWGHQNMFAIQVENKQLPERLPAGPSPAEGLMSSMMANFPETTYDYFPYAGLNRPISLYTVPQNFIEDITVVTGIDGVDGLVNLRVEVSDGHVGKGTARLHQLEAALDFKGGFAEVTLRVPSARFWSPTDPYLYPLTIRLGDGSILDVYTLEIGIRTIAILDNQLMLNSEPLNLTGFGKHEDSSIHGRGLNLPLLVRDFDLLHWIGANAYRTAHYPHSEEEMALADRLGMLIIDEIPITELNFADSAELTAERLQQGQQVLSEMIARDKNHPSVILWCIGNEPMVGNPFGPTNPSLTSGIEKGDQFFQVLYQQAHLLDPSRPVILVGVQGGPPDWFARCDVIGINRYYGWYTQQGRLDQAIHTLEQELDTLHQTFGKPILFTEFGADTLAGSHSTPPEMWTEEFQVEFLRRYLDAAAVRPFVTGTLAWTFADFKTGQSTGRAMGQNHKGVFTRDRQPKMAAHFLRSRWGKNGEK
jgi:beta-glucuronidase